MRPLTNRDRYLVIVLTLRKFHIALRACSKCLSTVAMKHILFKSLKKVSRSFPAFSFKYFKLLCLKFYSKLQSKSKTIIQVLVTKLVNIYYPPPHIFLCNLNFTVSCFLLSHSQHINTFQLHTFIIFPRNFHSLSSTKYLFPGTL